MEVYSLGLEIWKPGNLEIWKVANLEPWGWKSVNLEIWKSRGLKSGNWEVWSLGVGNMEFRKVFIKFLLKLLHEHKGARYTKNLAVSLI